MVLEHDTETTLLARHAPDVRVRRFAVEVKAGRDEGVRVESDGEEFTIGTAPGNRLMLRDPTVSRHHCVIVSSPSGFLIRDLDSTNGTFIDDLQVEAAFLRHGVSIRVGITRMDFVVLDATITQDLSDALGDLVGLSIPMRRLFNMLPRVAKADATLLLQGETGTGKSHLAEVIHELSPRAGGPLVVLDCAAIPPTLIESELFGHEKGAFTGADSARPGAFEQAEGGTLLLEEIGELPFEMQAKLLRAIEDRVIRRLGATAPTRVDCRVIAATNRELRHEVNRGAFRSDLFYRLNTLTLRVPPLRERRDDIPVLIEHFLRTMGGDSHTEALLKLTEAWGKRDWPGNVRELRGAVERALILGNPGTIPPPARLPSKIPASGRGLLEVPTDVERSYREDKAHATAVWERKYLGRLLERHGDNLTHAARAAKMDRNYLRELARRHGLIS